MSDIEVVLPDGASRSLSEGATAADLALSIGKRLAREALAAEIDGEIYDLAHVLTTGQRVSLVTPSSSQGREILRHSTAHVLAQAVTRLWPGAKYAIGPAIENGFYYDFELPNGEHFNDDDLVRIEKSMREIINENQSFVRRELNYEEGLSVFREQPFKVEIINKVRQGTVDDDDLGEVEVGPTVSVYENADAFVDLCRGPHVPTTSYLGHFKLMRVAGAYWRGDESRPQLQRVYGTAWESASALTEHLHQLEEAELRDHRRLVTELDLLSFPSELGGGLAVWHPRGAIVRKEMEDFSRARHLEGGYEFVVTPHLANAKLFETSGHLGFYKDGMYPPMELDNGTYYMKPMNCPMHCLVFRSRARSYRELPLRLYELGTVYRYERAGTLHGLMRIRGFTQDDSHIYCTPEQLHGEISSLLSFVMSVLRAFGFSDFTANLSTKDPQKYVGSDEIWEASTSALRSALNDFGLEYQEKKGDAAFYGPKIDIDVRDAIGRTWQLSTIQCDFNHPERFDLEYVGADNQRHRPIMLHRALFGSIERFFGVLLEHYAGNLPTWLAPEQVRVLGVRDDHDDYARTVVDALRADGRRAQTQEATEPLGARIRRAKMEKVPYILVVGDDDVTQGTVGINARGSSSPHRGVTLESFRAGLTSEVETHGAPEETPWP